MAENRIIATDRAPAAIGPYSQAVAGNGMLYASGQIAIDPATGNLTGDTAAAQAEQACRNIAAVLEAAGTDFSHVVKTTCFLADMADFSAFNEVYARWFVSRPARSCVAVSALPKGALCEIEIIAAL